MRRVHILVSGRVQGVFFRKATQQQAKRLGVLGSAKNLPDGRVEIIAEAETATLEAFIAWCHKGPVAARVDDVQLTELTITTPLNGFDIQ
ncbi:acylphosphatase [Methylocucumis oryzae]|uniref:acylphosphatase n=1 Tax=Methylocucumis oryzae TaxID=1632867 RepID=A0A0F3IJV3_9GAMM|nr:acylphosphatase [Methylocucumis oryzae]KJV05834.1 acylphosphatase [Methylocucumis oryzae]